MPDDRLLSRLYDEARAATWRVDRAAFGHALDASAAKTFAGRQPDVRELERFLSGLHLQDLALACACAAGDDEAWRHFVTTFRPQLYRAADAIDPGGRARELADSLYGDLFGLKGSGTERQSLFRYFHGRSSLATWLRAVLSQRHIDRLRERRRLDELPDDDAADAPRDLAPLPDPEHGRFLDLMRTALAMALAWLAPKDRLRLACYYAQQMTLAHVGRMLGEHEATVSRQLARTRRAIRERVERHLADDKHLTAEEIAECFQAISNDAGPLDLRELLGTGANGRRKNPPVDRSMRGEP